ncbi:ribbon-helix-helix protein, CopG family [Cupriavidus necator]|uniref:ribbon-helix-helix protein, CopG family n=1 Tax=Cupriavidus necator TaxID=106590 RepID=UPI0014904BA9|nr:ribbon-helix-helix protein, CopG family [Cupriavidus necator]NOV25619.1 ribbon-helix-helix protein, CopG family [Cupriavidus necator]
MLVSEETELTFTLDAQMHDALIAEASARGSTPSEILRDLVREYLDRNGKKRDYEAFLHSKVEASRASMRDLGGIPAEQIEAEFAAWRTAARRRA